MKKITLLFLMLFTAFFWQVNAQSTINITNTGGSYTGEKWVSVTTEVDGGGTVVWAQGSGVQGDSSGLINENISLAPGTYYVNCYDQYADSWDGTLISVTAYGATLSDNGGVTPDDGTDTDATSGWDGTADELEASLMIVVPSPPSCPPPIALSSTPSSLTETTLGWTAGGSETNWTVEYGATGFTLGAGTSMAATTNSQSVTGLTAGNSYDFYVVANCGGSGDSTPVGPFTWSQPKLGDSCALPIAATVEADCGTATPITIDYSTAADLGTTDLSCDAFGVNTGAWLEFTAPAAGGVRITFTDTNEYAIFDACGGTEITCVSTATNQGDITGLTAGTVYKLAIWKDSATTGTTDVCLTLPPSCIEPSALNVSNLAETSADLGWTENGTATSWNIELGATGFTPTGTATNTGVANPFSATGLTGETGYDFYVQTDCGVDGTSAWVGPFTFTTFAPAPANDECGTAIALTVNSDYSCAVVTSGTTKGATNSSQPDDVSGTPTGDVWYSFTATADSHRIELSNVVNQGGGTSTSTDMGMGLYDVTGGCGSLVFVGTSDPNTYNASGLTIGTSYLVRVYGWFGTIQNNNFDICVGTPPPPPANDNCATATVVSALPYNNTMDATGATNTGGFVAPTGCGSMNDGVWYTFTVGVTGTVDIALTGVTGWDPEIAIYSGSCGTFTCVNNADVGGTGTGESLTAVSVTAGIQYWINIGNFSGTSDGSEGPLTLDISSTDTTVLSVDNNTLEGFNLYPNPVKNELFLNAQDNIQEVEVYNLLGSKVMSVKPNLVRTSVSLESLSTGMYVVKVKVNNKVGSYKIIKE